MKILLISPKFFNYHEVIKEKIEEKKHQVDWYNDRPYNNSFMKAIIRINKKYVIKIIENYFNNILVETNKKSYDKIIFISGQSLSFTEEMISKLRKCQPQAEFILYQWDSIENFKYIKTMYKFFDRCYSFDENDALQNEKLKFLPLFYHDQYKLIGSNLRTNYQNDICFIGTAHPKKYKLIKEMSEQCKDVFPQQFIYFFLPSRLVYFYHKWKSREFKNAKFNEFNFNPISPTDTLRIIEDSFIIFDSPQANQDGLTIRVLECLGAKRKLITTNKNIVNYDFYREENIYVYQGKFDYENIFFKTNYVTLPRRVYEKYSIDYWIDELLQ